MTFCSQDCNAGLRQMTNANHETRSFYGLENLGTRFIWSLMVIYLMFDWNAYACLSFVNDALGL
jgi:hypothetical protein